MGLVNICAKFLLSSWSRSGWKLCGGRWVGFKWLLSLTLTLVALELLWVELGYVGFWQSMLCCNITSAIFVPFYINSPPNRLFWEIIKKNSYVLGVYPQSYTVEAQTDCLKNLFLPFSFFKYTEYFLLLYIQTRLYISKLLIFSMHI